MATLSNNLSQLTSFPVSSLSYDGEELTMQEEQKVADAYPFETLLDCLKFLHNNRIGLIKLNFRKKICQFKLGNKIEKFNFRGETLSTKSIMEILCQLLKNNQIVAIIFPKRILTNENKVDFLAALARNVDIDKLDFDDSLVVFNDADIKNLCDALENTHISFLSINNVCSLSVAGLRILQAVIPRIKELNFLGISYIFNYENVAGFFPFFQGIKSSLIEWINFDCDIQIVTRHHIQAFATLLDDRSFLKLTEIELSPDLDIGIANGVKDLLTNTPKDRKPPRGVNPIVLMPPPAPKPRGLAKISISSEPLGIRVPERSVVPPGPAILYQHTSAADAETVALMSNRAALVNGPVNRSFRIKGHRSS